MKIVRHWMQGASLIVLGSLEKSGVNFAGCFTRIGDKYIQNC